MAKIRKAIALLLALCCVAVSVIGCGNIEKDSNTQDEERYSIDFKGQDSSFEGAKKNYLEGDKVSLTFPYIATDTDYTFYVDGEVFNADYDSKKDVYKIKFKMPDHDVEVYYESRNTMEPPYEPEEFTGENKPLWVGHAFEYIDDEDYDYGLPYYYTSEAAYFTVDDDHSALQAALDEIKDETIEKYTKVMEDLKQEAADAYAVEGTDEFRGYYKNRRVSLCRADEVVMSYVQYDDVDLGPGCRYTTVSGHNLDTVTGEELALIDVVMSMDKLKEAVLDKASQGGYDPVYNGLFEKVMDEAIKEKVYVSNDYFSWNICYEGLWLHFPADLPYDVQGATCGRNTMFIPFAGNEDLFDEKYLNVPESYCYDIEMMNGKSEIYSVDIDGTGVYEDFSATALPDEEQGDWIEEVSVLIGEESIESVITQDIWGYTASGVMVHTSGGDNYLYISELQENDYECVAIYKVGRTLKYRDIIYGSVKSIYTSVSDPENMSTMSDPEDFLICETDFKMGTFNKYAHFKVGTGGSPDITDEYWKYPESDYYGITAIMDMKLMKVDEDGKELGFDTLKKNTGVRPYRTDDDKYIDIIDEAGNIWRLTLSKGPYGEDYLEEQQAFELFDGLLYAG